MSDTRPSAVIVLAAGGGTRMRSRTPKVLHRIGGQSLIQRAVGAARGLDPEHLVVVVGHGREEVGPHVTAVDPGVTTAVQEEQHGTGHAVQCALDSLRDTAGPGALTGTVLVTYGDVPLLTTDVLAALRRRHESAANAATVLTAVVEDPSGYGRVVRETADAAEGTVAAEASSRSEGGAGSDGMVASIVEHKDASDAQRAIREINSGIYAFDGEVLVDALTRIGADNAQGELYLTDVVAVARGDGRRVGALRTSDVWQTEGVNDRVQLSRMGAEVNRRTLDRLMRAGVTVVDPATTWVDDTVRCEADVTLLPGVQLHGDTTVARGAVVGPDTTLTDVHIGAEAVVLRSHGSGAVVGEGATVGPFAYLRSGTRLGAHGKVGTFVETKNAAIGESAKVPHLSYVGDATVGEHSNVGAGTIFANYDGLHKHSTTIGNHCRTGSNNTFVAPVEIGDGAATGAGTVVRRDVPPGALAVSAGPQRHVEDWTLRKRAGTPAATAAETAQARARDSSDQHGRSASPGATNFPRGTSAGETEPEASSASDPSEEKRQ